MTAANQLSGGIELWFKQAGLKTKTKYAHLGRCYLRKRSPRRVIPVLLRLLYVAVPRDTSSGLTLLVSENSSLPIVLGLQELTLAVPSPWKLPAAPPGGQAIRLQPNQVREADDQ